MRIKSKTLLFICRRFSRFLASLDQPLTFEYIRSLRILYFGGLFLIYSNVDHEPYTQLDTRLFVPTGLMALMRPILEPPLVAYQAMRMFLLASLLLAAVGLKPNLFKFLSFVLLVTAGSYADGFGTTFVSGVTVPIAFVLLFINWELKPLAQNHWRIVFCAQVILILHYFFSGWQKLADSGSAWILNNVYIQSLIQHKGAWASSMLLAHPILLQAALAIVVAIELLAPLSLLNPTSTWAFGFLLISMHISIWHLLPVDFFTEWALSVFVLLILPYRPHSSK